MFECFLFVFLFYCFAIIVQGDDFEAESYDKSVSVAVIGSGISGTSFTAFLKKDQLLKNKVTVDLYEKSDQIGGRVRTIAYKDDSSSTLVYFDQGASIIHGSNEYIKNFSIELNLTRIQPTRVNNIMGIYNGERYSFISSKNKYYNILKFFYYFNIFNFMKLKTIIKKIQLRFVSFYEKLNNSTGYTEVSDLLESVDLYNITQQSIESYLYENGLNINSVLIKQLVNSVVRVNYNQPLSINGLAGAVGIIPLAEPDLFAIADGNHQIPHGLAYKYADNIYLSHTIESIEFNNNKFQLNGINNEYENFSRDYDYVIIATPLELSNIKLDNVIKSSRIQRKFTKTFTLFIESNINKSLFINGDFPASFLVHDSDNTIWNIPKVSSISSYYYNNKTNSYIYKIFSQERLNISDLEKVFIGDIKKSWKEEIDWSAYPTFKEKESFDSFKLHEKVYYINAFENAISCMECMAVASKNVALLVSNHIQLNYINKDSFEENIPSIEKSINEEL